MFERPEAQGPKPNKNKKKNKKKNKNKKVTTSEVIKPQAPVTSPITEDKTTPPIVDEDDNQSLMFTIQKQVVSLLEIEKTYAFSRGKDVETAIKLFRMKRKFSSFSYLDPTKVIYFEKSIQLGLAHPEHIDISCIYRERAKFNLSRYNKEQKDTFKTILSDFNKSIQSTEHPFTKALAYLDSVELFFTDINYFVEMTRAIDSAINILKTRSDEAPSKKIGVASFDEVANQIHFILNHASGNIQDLVLNLSGHDVTKKKSMLLNIERQVLQLMMFVQDKGNSNDKLLRFYTAQAKAWLKLDRSLYLTEAKAICEQALKLFSEDAELKKNQPVQYCWINYYYADALYRQGKYIAAQSYCEIANESTESTISIQTNLLLKIIQSKLDKKQDPTEPVTEDGLFKQALYQIGEGDKKKDIQEKFKHYERAVEYLENLKETFPKSKDMKLYDERLYYCYFTSATLLDSQDNQTPEKINTAFDLYCNAIDLGLESTATIDLAEAYIYSSQISERWAKEAKKTIEVDHHHSEAEESLDLALKQAKHKNTKLMVHMSKVEFYSRSSNFDGCSAELDAIITLLQGPEEAPMNIMGCVKDPESAKQLKEFINELINCPKFLTSEEGLTEEKKFELVSGVSNQTHQIIALSKITNKDSQAIRVYANQVTFLMKCKTPDLKLGEGYCAAGLALFKKDRRLIKEHPQEYYQFNYAYAKILLRKDDLINSKKYCENALHHKKIYTQANQQSNVKQLNSLLDQINHALFQKKSAELLELTTLTDQQLAVEEAFELHAKLTTEDKKTTALTLKLKQKIIDGALVEANDRGNQFKQLRQLMSDYKKKLEQLKQLHKEMTTKLLKDIEAKADALKVKLNELLIQISSQFPALEGKSLDQTTQWAALPIEQSSKLQKQMRNNDEHCKVINAFLDSHSVPKLIAAVASSKKNARKARQKQDSQAVPKMAEKKKSFPSLKQTRVVAPEPAPLMTEEETSTLINPITTEPSQILTLDTPAPEIPTPEIPTPEIPTPEIPTPEIPTPETPLVETDTLLPRSEAVPTLVTLRVDEEVSKLSSPVATTEPETPSSGTTNLLTPSEEVSPVSSLSTQDLASPLPQGTTSFGPLPLLGTETLPSTSSDGPLPLHPSPTDVPSVDHKTLTADSIGLSEKTVKVIETINKALQEDLKLAKFNLKVSLYGTKVLNYLLNLYHGITIHSKDTDLFIPKVPDIAAYQLARVLQKEKFIKPNQKNVIHFKNYVSEDKSIEIAVCSEDYYSYDPFHFTRASITIDANGEVSLYCPDELQAELKAKLFELDLPEVNSEYQVKNFFTRLIKYYEKITPLLPNFKLGHNFRVAIDEGEGDEAHWQRKYFSELLDVECPHVSRSPAHLEMISIIKNDQFVESSLGERIIGEFCQAVAEKYYEGPLSEQALQTVLTQLRLQCDAQTITAEDFDSQIHDYISSAMYEEPDLLPPLVPELEAPPQYLQVSGTIHHVHHLYGPIQSQRAFVTPDGQHVVEQLDGHDIVMPTQLLDQMAWDTSQSYRPPSFDQQFAAPPVPSVPERCTVSSLSSMGTPSSQQMNFFPPKERKVHRSGSEGFMPPTHHGYPVWTQPFSPQYPTMPLPQSGHMPPSPHSPAFFQGQLQEGHTVGPDPLQEEDEAALARKKRYQVWGQS